MKFTFLLRRTTLAPSRSSTPTPRPTKRFESTSPKPEQGLKNESQSFQSQAKPKPQSQSQSQSQSHHPVAEPAQSNTSLPPETPAPAPAPTPPKPGRRSLRQIIQAGPVGRVGRSYARFQEKRPYTTQLCSSVVIYLFGDLTAQYLFPPEKENVRRDAGVEKGEEGAVGGYDPWRTMRHLTVGIGSSIPTYNW